MHACAPPSLGPEHVVRDALQGVQDSNHLGGRAVQPGQQL